MALQPPDAHGRGLFGHPGQPRKVAELDAGGVEDAERVGADGQSDPGRPLDVERERQQHARQQRGQVKRRDVDAGLPGRRHFGLRALRRVHDREERRGTIARRANSVRSAVARASKADAP